MQININDKIKVVLTDVGAQAYNKDRNKDVQILLAIDPKLARTKEKMSPLKSEGDVWEGSIWEIMKVLAPLFGNGFPVPFKNCSFEILGDITD